MLAMIFFYLKLNCARKKMHVQKNLHCPNCGEKFSRDNVTYNILKKYVTGSNGKVTTRAKVKIICTCSKCGHVHEFTDDFTVDSIDTSSSGKVSGQTYTIDEKIDELFSWQ